MGILALDVYYRAADAVVGVAFTPEWSAAPTVQLHAVELGTNTNYEPGAFYKRELYYLERGLLAFMRADQSYFDAVIVDGYAWLDSGKPGLGARFRQHMGLAAPVIGVAKTKYRGAEAVSREVVRNGAKRPLYVSAAGMDVDEAARRVQSMYGAYRIPDLLRQADQLSRRPTWTT